MGKRKALGAGVWKFDEGLAKWELFWPVHQMWTNYIAEVMGLSLRPEVLPTKEQMGSIMPNTAGLQAKLVKADFHGCIVKGEPVPAIEHPVFLMRSVNTVKECKNASRVGCEGIVVHETSNTFKVVTKQDKLKGV
jgi:ribonuclease P protein subunit POP4